MTNIDLISIASAVSVASISGIVVYLNSQMVIRANLKSQNRIKKLESLSQVSGELIQDLEYMLNLESLEGSEFIRRTERITENIIDMQLRLINRDDEIKIALTTIKQYIYKAKEGVLNETPNCYVNVEYYLDRDLKDLILDLTSKLEVYIEKEWINAENNTK